ncbi:MAG TPA: glycosyltransferase family 39 protein [Chroococcales cyanobacterium]
MRFSKSFLLITLAYFALRILWIFSVPMVEAPDEFSHAWVFQFLKDHARLPHPAEVYGGGPSAVYGPIPQLGYIPHVLVASALFFVEPTLAARFGSLICGYVAVVFAYLLGKELFGKEQQAAIALPLMFVFHPQMVLVNAYTNNDSTTCALTTATTYMLVRVLKRGLSIKDAVIFGFLLGYTALCKYSGYSIYPAAALALILTVIIHRISIVDTLKYVATISGIALALSGWWFYNTYHDYHGDLLGTKTMRDIWARTYNRPLEYYQSPSHIIKELRWWRMTAFSYWGMFGYMTRYLYRPLYFGYLGFMLISALAGIKQLVMGMIGLFKKQDLDAAERKERAIERAIWWTFATCCIFNIGAMIWASTINLGGAQGRYLFPSEAPLMALLVAGLKNVGGKAGRILVVSLVVFNALVAIWAFIWLFPVYGFRVKP